MSTFIRFRKAQDNKFISIEAENVVAVEDIKGKLNETSEETDLVILITKVGNFALEESSNKVLGLLAEAGVKIVK